jgi:phosphohistidine phosphatase SixA
MHPVLLCCREKFLQKTVILYSRCAALLKSARFIRCAHNAGFTSKETPMLLTRRYALAALSAPWLGSHKSHAQAQAAADASDAAWTALKAAGGMVLFRHALAPGGGDPPGFKLDDCSTQRNLSDEGREQARRIGQALRQRGVKVQEVWHSAWCRTRDTAQLAFPDLRAPALRPEPVFNSFFSDRSSAPAQTQSARQMLLDWRGSGCLVVITHQVNITALTDIFPQSGEGVVLRRQAGMLKVVGQLTL